MGKDGYSVGEMVWCQWGLKYSWWPGKVLGYDTDADEYVVLGYDADADEYEVECEEDARIEPWQGPAAQMMAFVDGWAEATRVIRDIQTRIGRDFYGDLVRAVAAYRRCAPAALPQMAPRERWNTYINALHSFVLAGPAPELPPPPPEAAAAAAAAKAAAGTKGQHAGPPAKPTPAAATAAHARSSSGGDGDGSGGKRQKVAQNGSDSAAAFVVNKIPDDSDDNEEGKGKWDLSGAPRRRPSSGKPAGAAAVKAENGGSDLGEGSGGEEEGGEGGIWGKPGGVLSDLGPGWEEQAALMAAVIFSSAAASADAELLRTAGCAAEPSPQ
ncbi:hypothetical protein JKP88DRAFT_347751 [Tribonema minus]|uniref:PWWP domain-containing protein n=1 Tax=Tribonema minus TaxID=303371 RepID=A0A836CKY5_9STRA|nr:hypothetical protein JKP88DRAFT_347751 [Tribonema minus]